MYPKVNHHILIDINDNHSCRSVIAEVGDTDMFISFPMDRTIIGLLTIGAKLDISFIVDDNKYKFKSEIIGRKVDPIPLIQITKPAEKNIVKVQLRENFRVSASINVRLKDQDFITTNVSAGGLLFTCNQNFQLQEGELVTGTLFIPNGEPLTFKGEIKRISMADNQDKKFAGIEFLNINQRDRSKILQYCFEKQRQMRTVGR
jgi:c-di-GMP-binding flagellar brake protein YcgR